MAVDYGILERTPSIASRFMAGRQEAAAEQDRNMLRQMQMEQMGAQRENILAQREQRMAQAEERRSLEARRQQAQEAMARFSDTFARAGYKFDRTTLGDMFNVGRETGNESLLKTAIEGLKTLDEQEAYDREMAQFRGTPANAMAPSAEGAPAPVNAMAVNREMVQNMLMSPNPRVRAQGEALRKSLPEEFAQPEIVRLQQYLGQLTPGSAEYTAVQDRIKMLTTRPEPAKTVVNLPPQEAKERGARGELLVEQYKTVSDAARIAQRTIPALETQANILDSGFRTGFGTDVQKVGASVLAALGVSEAAKFATDAQTFLGAAQQAVLQRQLDQKGPQTEADAQRITQTGAQLGNTPEANRFLIDIAKAQLKRDIEQRNFYDKWWKTNKTYDGAEDAWFSGEGGRSLFDRPELKKYAPNRPSAAEQIPGRQAPAAPSRTVTRTGTLNGRRVVQYSDGTTEYVD